MTESLTLEKVLKRAVNKEIEAQRFYIGLSEMVNDSVARDAFQMLSREEKVLQDRLEQHLRGDLKHGALSTKHVVDYRIAELLDEPEVSADLALKDTFLLAANREKASHELYLNLARIHSDGEVKRMLEVLAAQESRHKQRVETLYTEVAFPQTDGG